MEDSIKNSTIVFAIILGVMLSIVALFANIQVVSAQDLCYDARGNIIECPPRPENKNKKTPTPQRRNNPPSATATLTPTSTPTVTLTPTVPFTPTPPPTLTPAANEADVFSAYEASFYGNIFGPTLFLGGLFLILFWFYRRRKGRRPSIGPTDGDKSGGNMPLQTELDFPDDDTHSKDSGFMEINSPGYNQSIRDLGVSQTELLLDDNQGHDGSSTFRNEIDADSLRKHENYFEEENLPRGSVLPDPKKFPKVEDETDPDTGRASNDDD